MSDLEAAIDQLEVDLLRTAADTRGLERSAAALNLINSFLLALDLDAAARGPLQELQAALVDVAQGRKTAMLQVANDPKAKKRSAEEQQLFPLAAAIVSLFVLKRMALDQAVRRVGAVLGIDPKTLKHYRKNLTGGKIGSDELKLYREYITNLKAESPDTVLLRLKPLSMKEKRAKA